MSTKHGSAWVLGILGAGYVVLSQACIGDEPTLIGSTGTGGHAMMSGTSNGGSTAMGTGGGAGCKPGEKVCDSKCVLPDPSNGCDSTSCDPCPHAHGDVHCVAGSCEAFHCDTGYEDCNGKASDGCEVNTANDPDNCGQCTNPCPDGKPFCGGGLCSAIPCTAPLADCDGLLKDQCEVNTSTDPQNCGACTHVCGAQNETVTAPTCVGSACVFNCDSGWAHCSTDPANDGTGCNVDTTSDSNNCGSCLHQCATTGGTGLATCSGSACSFNCTSPYISCGSGHDTNGCNVNASNDSQNCGGCGIACGSLPGTTGNCVNSACECLSGYNDNDGSPGCEAALPTAVPEASSLQLWLKGDYGFVAGNIWKDQSGNGRDANPYYGTVSTVTVNSRQAINFQGAELLINTGFPAWSGATVFAVQNTTTANALITFGVSYNPSCTTTAPGGAPNCAAYDMMAFGGFGAIGLEMCDGNIGTCFQAYDAAPPSGWVRTVGVLTPNATPSYKMYWNGADKGDEGHNVVWPFPAPWASARKDTIIGWNGYRGAIAEIIVFNEPISDASRQAIDAYLSNKWGI